MSKYYFSRMTPSSFEAMAQALLEKAHRKDNNLIQFGDGQDGGREAVFDYFPDRADLDTQKAGKCIVQVKFHELGLRGWQSARSLIVGDLESELKKVVNEYKLEFVKYILITNVPFTGVLQVGTRDRCEEIVSKWREKIPCIEIWDAADISRMLDADSDTRTAYLDTILPGDVLKSLFDKLEVQSNNVRSVTKAYLQYLVQSQRAAKADEAGDDEGTIALEDVFVDVSLSLEPNAYTEILDKENRFLDAAGVEKAPTISNESIRSSHAVLFGTNKHILLKGGPGVGKSTITQFLAILHASRILGKPLYSLLLKKLKLPSGIDLETVDSHIELRFPLRVELRRYSSWISEGEPNVPHLAQYIVERINATSSGDLSMNDLFEFASKNPILLMLDGLDEVPNVLLRKEIFSQLSIFLNRCDVGNVDIKMILSTRPQGYEGDFEEFYPVVWSIDDLQKSDFDSYATNWLDCRVVDQDERDDARARIEQGMNTPAVAEMAKSLLQATVMLNLARKKQVIPEARHTLFKTYVQVIFNREKNKTLEIKKYENALLRLHELVGYRLIERAQYNDQQGVVSGGEFEELLESVMNEYGPSAVSGATFGTLIKDRETIVELSRNRVCLLAGKGDDQENIDFVIQSFREYFAAAYIYEHEQKCSEKTFLQLAMRSRTWANVFKFYVAFEAAGTQKAWITDASAKDFSCDNHHGLSLAIRLRRALADVLPEITQLKNKTENVLLKYLLDSRHMWAWSEESIRTLGVNLRSFGSGDHLQFLEDTLLPLNSSDELSRKMTLLLFLHYMRPKESFRVSQIVQSAMQDDLLPESVMLDAMTFNVVSNVPVNCQNQFIRNGHIYNYGWRHPNAPQLNESDVLVLLTRSIPVDQIIKNWSSKDKFLNIIAATASQIKIGRMSLSPYLISGNGIEIKRDVIVFLQSLDTKIADYYAAILEAKLSRRDLVLYNEAEKLECSNEISFLVSGTSFSVKNQLGGLIADKKTGLRKRADHKLSKTFIRKLEKCINNVTSNSQLAELLVVVKVEHWDLFAEFYDKDVFEHGVVALKDLSVSRNFEISQDFSILPTFSSSFDMSKFLECLRLIDNRESSTFENISLDAILFSKYLGAPVADENTPLEDFLPHLEWLSASSEYTILKKFLVAPLLVSDVNIETLLELSNSGHGSISGRLPFGRNLIDFRCRKLLSEDAIEKLSSRLRLATRSSSIELLLLVMQNFPFDKSDVISNNKMLDALSAAYYFAISNYDSNADNAICQIELINMLSVFVGKIDLEFLFDEDQYNLYKDNGSYTSSILTVLHSYVQGAYEDFEITNKDSLDKILTRRHLYSTDLQDAVLATALRITESELEPLDESSWKTPEVDW